MIILTDCLTEIVDEGALKVANSLTKRMKEKYKDTYVISYGDRKSHISDIHLSLNKFFLNISLFKLIKREKEELLYIPFASNTKASIIRTFMLSLMTKKRLKVMFVLKHPMHTLFAKLLKLANPKLYVLSKESYEYYTSLGVKDVTYIKTGVDTNKFVPVSKERKQALRKKYNIDPNKTIILHVGHLHNGRNVDKLMLFKDMAKPYLVVSSVSKQDEILKDELKKNNVKIIDTYVEKIEEFYQLSDVYFFPVIQQENCIDVPLSVLEAAACNIPIMTTQYGELKSFMGEDDFYFIDSFEKDEIENIFKKVISKKDQNSRKTVLSYDWNIALNELKD